MIKHFQSKPNIPANVHGDMVAISCIDWKKTRTSLLLMSITFPCKPLTSLSERFFSSITLHPICNRQCELQSNKYTLDKLNLSLPSKAIVPCANSLDLDETTSNSASCQGPSCLTLKLATSKHLEY